MTYSKTRIFRPGQQKPEKPVNRVKFWVNIFAIDPFYQYISQKRFNISAMGVKIRPRFNRNGKKLDKDEKARISIGVYWDSKKRKFLATDYFVTEEQWDAKKLIVNNRHENYQYINAKIKELVSKLETYEFKLQSNGQHLTLDLLDDFARRNFENYDNMTFNQYFKKQLETRKFNTVSTYQTHKKTYNKFNEFRKDVHFHELTVSLVEQFDEYMKEQGLMTNSRSNHHKTLKANLHIAATEGYIEHAKIPYSTQIGGMAGKFKVKKEQGSIVNLDFEERERIEGLEYKDKPHLDRYRKIFLFMCYTGLRISDMENLRPEHLHHTQKGYQIDLKKMIKTRKPVFLELHTLFEGKPELILKEFLEETFGTSDYNEIREMKDDSPVFSNLTGQVLNRELKIIAEDAKVYKNISAHVGRHTFGTQMAVLSNGNVSLIRDLLGHGKTETTMIYIRLAEKMRGQQLKKVDWNAHKEINDAKEPGQQTPDTDKKKSKKDKVANDLKPASPDSNDQQVQQIKDYIINSVFPSLDLTTKGKLGLSLSMDSIRNYVSLLPFRPEDYNNYKENPIEIQGYIQDAGFLGETETIQDKFNNHAWVKGACLKLSILFMPVLEQDGIILI